MNAFISHNKSDKETARLLAICLVEQGINVWFDEWEIKPGESITGGIEKGLSDADTFVLIWSANAKKSNWVGTELKAYIRRRVDDDSLRIVPIMIDNTSLPTLVADYRGFTLDSSINLQSIAFEISGQTPDLELAKRLQVKLMELTEGYANPNDPFPYLICPSCGSAELIRSTQIDPKREDEYYVIKCKDCNWYEWTEI